MRFFDHQTKHIEVFHQKLKYYRFHSAATPTAATTKGKRKLSPTSALLGNRPARRPTTELQAARTASVLASLLERGRETAWDTGDEDEAET